MRDRSSTRLLSGQVVRGWVFLGLLTAVMAGGSSSAAAVSLTIDNFEEGAFSLQTSGPLVEDTQTGLSPGNVLSGRRRVSLEGDAASLPSSVSLTLTGADDAAAFFRPSGGPEGGAASVSFMYEFDTPLDLTGGGTLDRLVLRYSDATPPLPLGPRIEFQMNDEPGFIGDLAIGADQVQGTGEYSVPLPLDASFDFTQIAWIILTIQSFSDTASSSLLASDFVAVPEPGAAVLVMTAILGLALRQKRHARFEWPCPRDEKRWTSGPPSSSRTSPRVTAHRM